MNKLVNVLIIGSSVIGSGVTFITNGLSASKPIAKQLMKANNEDLFTLYAGNEVMILDDVFQYYPMKVNSSYFFKINMSASDALNSIRGFQYDYGTDLGGGAERIDIELVSSAHKTSFYNNICANKLPLLYYGDAGERDRYYGYLDYSCNSAGDLSIELDSSGNIYTPNMSYYLIFNPEFFFEAHESTYLNESFLVERIIDNNLSNLTSVKDFKDNFRVRAVELYTGYTLPSGTTRDITIRVEDHLTIEDLKKLCSAKDFFGRDVAFSLIDTTELYQLNKVGLFTFRLIATNSDGTTASANLRVNVTDNTNPVISQEEPLYIPCEEPLTWQLLLDSITYSDNIECVSLFVNGQDSSDKRFSVDLLHERDREEFSLNLDFGTYTFSAYVVDGSGRRSETISLTVIATDNTAPIIRSDYPSDTHTIGLTNAYKAYIDAILSRYSAVDMVDGDTPVTYELPEFNQAVGTFSVVLSAVDQSSNEATKTVTFNVIDNTEIYFEIEKNLYLSTLHNPYTKAEIEVLVLKKEAVSRDEVVALAINDREYQSASRAGRYSIAYKLEFADGKEKVDVINFQVIDTDNSKKENWFMKNIWTPICNFFIKLKNAVVSVFKGKGWKFQL